MNIKKNALVVGTFITFCTWLLMAVGAFSLPDGLIHNLFVRLSPSSAAPASNVLIIRGGFEQMGAGEEVWLSILRELRRQGAGQIVFTFLPAHASRQFFEEAAAGSDVIFGRRVREDASAPGAQLLEPLPPAAANLDIRSGILEDPSDEFGVHRYQKTTVEVGGTSYPTLVAAAADGFRRKPVEGTAPVLINFIGREGGLPHVSLELALAGKLIPELVKGKSVLVGFSDSAHEPKLVTPLAGGKDISLLDYRGHALDTLIGDRGIRVIPLIVQLILVAAIVFAGLMFQTLFEMRFFTWLTLTAASIFLVACWLLLVFGHFWFPVTEPLVAFSLTFLVIFRQRVLVAEQAVNTMVLNLSAKLKQRIMPESFYSSQEHWSQVITMVNQTLNLTRAIFLEKVPDDHRVREIKALHCSITDISENRRDYERPPYSTAIANGGPIRIEQANYLTAHETREDQYLVPLNFGGQTLGFWAFGIAPETAEKIPYFEGTIRDFGKQISELLFRRQEWQAQQQRQSGFMRNFLDLSRDIPHEELRKFIDLFESRVNTLETVFAKLGTATILYDLFGRVLLVNKRMVEIMQAAGMAPYEMTALDLVVTLTDLPAEEIRQHFHRVLLEHGEISLPTPQMHAEGGEYILRIRPLIENRQKSRTSNASPFSIYGILLELSDVSDVKRHERNRDQFIGQIPTRLSELLEPMANNIQQIGDESIPAQARQTLVGELQERASATRAFVAEIEECLGAGRTSGLDCYPVDGLPLLRRGAVEAERVLAQRRISTAISVPPALPFVWAAPRALEEAFCDLIVMLGNDAIPNSVVRINAEEEGDRVVYRFACTGFGMPLNVLKRIMFSDEMTDSVEHRKARTAVMNLLRLQAEIEATSEIGSGTSVEIRMKKCI